MKFNTIKEMSLFEHRFWLQILGDHSRFILNALSPTEVSFIEMSNKFISLFDNLLEKSRQPLSEDELTDLNNQAFKAAMEIRKFKLSILSRHITGKISISLPPTFINHMVNELDEYLFILNSLIKGNPPPAGPIHFHLLWLLDGSGHASTIASNLDMTEKELIKKSKEYSKKFDDLYLKALEFNGYLRTGFFDFPALGTLNEDANETMTCFKNFLTELENEIIKKKVLGAISPLTPDHMFREECYYLIKLSMVSDIKEPQCDPAKPRIKL